MFPRACKIIKNNLKSEVFITFFIEFKKESLSLFQRKSPLLSKGLKLKLDSDPDGTRVAK